MGITKTHVSQIKKFANNFYKNLDQTHGIEHLNRTVKLAVYLGRKEKANIQIVELSAILHQFHNDKIVKKFLEKIKMDKDIIEQIVHCVYCSDRKNIHNAKTIEAKVVFDADKLQVIGPFGIVREISCSMEAPIDMKFREALRHTRIVEQKCFEKLQTETAKELAKKPHDYIVNFWKILDKWDKVRF